MDSAAPQPPVPRLEISMTYDFIKYEPDARHPERPAMRVFPCRAAVLLIIKEPGGDLAGRLIHDVALPKDVEEPWHAKIMTDDEAVQLVKADVVCLAEQLHLTPYYRSDRLTLTELKL